MAFLAKINDVSGGDITSIVSGTGLSGGATSGIVTLSVDAAQTGITSLGTQAADFKVGDGYGLVVGHSAQVAVAVGTSELQVLGTDQGESSLTLANWNATAGNMSHMNFLRGGGGSLAGSTIAPADAKLGSITWNTSDGSDYLSISAQIVAIADGTPGGNDTPGLLSFLTTASGATAATERLRIDSAGLSTFAGNVQLGGGDVDTANAYSALVIEKDDHSRLEFLNPVDKVGTIWFSDTTEGMGRIEYSHSSNAFEVRTNATLALTISSAQDVTFAGAIKMADDESIIFGAGSDASIEYDENGTDQLRIVGDTIFENSIHLSDAGTVDITTPLLAGGDHTTTGLTAQMLAGGAIAAFDLVCIHTTTQEVVEADASNLATTRVIGIAPAAISDTATGTILLHGFIRDDSWNWTTGATLYLSETAGAMTETAPTTSGAFVKVVGIALEPDVVYINPDNSWIEIA